MLQCWHGMQVGLDVCTSGCEGLMLCSLCS
jgi:hypothetical protein